MKNISALFIALAMAAFVTQPLAAYPGPTKVVNYTGGHMKGKMVSGYCWTSSNASPRADAFRCMIGNSIMDPCFKINANLVACPQNLAANTGTLIALTKPLPAPNPKSPPKPWSFQIAGGSGIMCNAGTGTVIGNYPYYCQGNLVCTVPAPSPKIPAAFMAVCGAPSGPMSVKGARPMFVMTLWE